MFPKETRGITRINYTNTALVWKQANEEDFAICWSLSMLSDTSEILARSCMYIPHPSEAAWVHIWCCCVELFE